MLVVAWGPRNVGLCALRERVRALHAAWWAAIISAATSCFARVDMVHVDATVLTAAPDNTPRDVDVESSRNARCQQARLRSAADGGRAKLLQRREQVHSKKTPSRVPVPPT